MLDNRAKLRAQSYLSPEVEASNLDESAAHLIDGFEGRARAFLQVQQGCDHRCTFCIIPYARGPSRSVPMGAIAEQARRLVAADYREIVLTGVDLTAYGADLPGTPSLGQMVRRLLAAVPELERLRLSSLDPVEIDAELWRLLAEEPRLMPHLHLSLQSGDDLILKRMKRRHLRADAIEVAHTARALRPDLALGADLIAGFPTETEDMFRRSLDLIEECGLAFVHVFPYSPRPGTPAARMPPVANTVVKERAARLMGAIAEQARRLVAAGYREIVLTGVDLTAYGADLPGAPSLGQMARRLLSAVPELERLRLSSLDPVEIDAELWRLLAEEKRLMQPHLHLSLQAGDDLILKRMKRRHSRADAIAVARRARSLRPGIGVGC